MWNIILMNIQHSFCWLFHNIITAMIDEANDKNFQMMTCVEMKILIQKYCWFWWNRFPSLINDTIRGERAGPMTRWLGGCDGENMETCAVSHFPPQMFCWLAALEICDVRHCDTATLRHLSHSLLGGGGGGGECHLLYWVITLCSYIIMYHHPFPSPPSQMIVTSWAFVNIFSKKSRY